MCARWRCWDVFSPWRVFLGLWNFSTWARPDSGCMRTWCTEWGSWGSCWTGGPRWPKGSVLHCCARRDLRSGTRAAKNWQIEEYKYQTWVRHIDATCLLVVLLRYWDHQVTGVNRLFDDVHLLCWPSHFGLLSTALFYLFLQYCS